MGTQQMFLIILGAIIVGAAIYFGTSLFKNSASDANRDLVSHDVTYIAVDAQVYYKKPKELQGGGLDYTGFETSSFFKKYVLGKIKVKIQPDRNRVVITGTGTEIGKNGRTNVQVQGIVKPGSITITVKN